MANVTPIKGGDRLEAYLAKLAGKAGNPGKVRVGFLEGATYPDGTPVAMIAAIQNFGAPAVGIPPRPFFSRMVNREAGGWGLKMSQILKRVNWDGERALELMGAGIAGQLRQSIVETNGPALSPVTLLLRDRFPSNPEDITFDDVQRARADIKAGVKPAASGTGAKPLVWTGHLLASVDFEVTKSGEDDE